MSWDRLEAAAWLAAAENENDGDSATVVGKKAVLMQAGTGDAEVRSRRRGRAGCTCRSRELVHPACILEQSIYSPCPVVSKLPRTLETEQRSYALRSQ